jgi:hypothetical protein
MTKTMEFMGGLLFILLVAFLPFLINISREPFIAGFIISLIVIIMILYSALKWKSRDLNHSTKS